MVQLDLTIAYGQIGESEYGENHGPARGRTMTVVVSKAPPTVLFWRPPSSTREISCLEHHKP